MTKINIKYLNGEVVEKFEIALDVVKLDAFNIVLDGFKLGRQFGISWPDGDRIGNSINLKDGLIIEIKPSGSSGELDEGKQEPTKPEPVG